VSDKSKEAQQRRLEQLMKRWRRADSTQRRQSVDQIPAKKKSKPLPYKMQNTFEKSVQGMPGGKSIVKQIAAPKTGCRVRKDDIGLLKSARNANTTSGSYNRTIVKDETGWPVCDMQGRKVFGR